MHLREFLPLLLIIVAVVAGAVSCGQTETRPLLIAHRGASAYAPENTLAAFDLAVAQNADLIELDLHMTRDQALVCLHDYTLERTTNVEEVFPERYREVTQGGETQRHWYVWDFDLAEIQSLDAGSWFSEKFQGERIPTFLETIEFIGERAGLLVELKGTDIYFEKGFGMEEKVIKDLRRGGIEKASFDEAVAPRVIVQTFNRESLGRLAKMTDAYPLVLLVGMNEAEKWTSDAGLDELAAFASGIGPDRRIVFSDPAVVNRAHQRGLRVMPYTFRYDSLLSDFQSVQEEMAYFLSELRVDGVITDNPDEYPLAAGR